MSEAKFTKGKWSSCGVFEYYPSSAVSEDEQKENAHLIAAAPEMYREIESEIEFLKGLMEISLTGSTKNVTDVLGEKINSKQALLAKARGEHD